MSTNNVDLLNVNIVMGITVPPDRKKTFLNQELVDSAAGMVHLARVLADEFVKRRAYLRVLLKVYHSKSPYYFGMNI